jgi:hypothetical protein
MPPRAQAQITKLRSHARRALAITGELDKQTQSEPIAHIIAKNAVVPQKL